jgi:hypothetical protein
MTVIALGNLAVFLADTFMAAEQPIFASIRLMFFSSLVFEGEWWRMITFIFVPPFSRMRMMTPIFLIFYHVMGKILEAEWGRFKLNCYYLTGFLSVLAFGFVTGIPLTATQLNLSLFFAVATLVPDMQIRLMFILPVKVKWLALVYAGFVIYEMQSLGLLPLIPLLNYLLYFYPELRRLFSRYGRKEAVNFRREKRRIESRQQQSGYLRQCAVCGLTDADDPKMDFRYCSLCTGRKCYCQKHLFEHEHH